MLGPSLRKVIRAIGKLSNSSLEDHCTALPCHVWIRHRLQTATFSHALGALSVAGQGTTLVNDVPCRRCCLAQNSVVQ
jgi:hypothetical protein